MDETIQKITVYALPLIFGITLHEAAHAYVAKYFGDKTAYSQGRVSLNPIVHIDLFGTILIPLALFLLNSPFLFGYAKPVPVNFANLRKPKRDMAWVALAGPAANLLMAFLWLLAGMFFLKMGIEDGFFIQMVQAGLSVNLLLFAFNLLPIPPLDGGRILVSLLPHQLAYKFAQIEPYGFFIVMGLMVMKLLHFWMMPIMIGAQWLIQLLATPVQLLLGF